MILKTQLFQETCKTILPALDNNTANLELKAEQTTLYLSLTNREYYISVKYELAEPANFRAVVKADLFLNLIAGITSEEFELEVKNNYVYIKVNKSNYKLAMIYENDTLITLPVITLTNKTVEMPVSLEILKSILNVNAKELLKAKNADLVRASINDLQKLYYIDETGCFTFTTGACLNSFKLEKPVKLLLTDKIVKLFKLFKEDVLFSFGYDQLPNGITQAKAIFQTPTIYFAALVINDSYLLNKVLGPCTAAKNYVQANYANKIVLSSNMLLAAINRLLMFTKNSIDKVNMLSVYATITLTTGNEFIITDKLGNQEVVPIENGSTAITEDYILSLNISDLKLVLESYKDEFVTFNCGNHKLVVITRNNISNLISEGML